MRLTIYSDGGARGNPGPAAAGFVIYEKEKELWAEGKFLGQNITNNQAEYRSLILSLEKAKELGAEEISVFLDSELIVRQLKREYKVKDSTLAVFFSRVEGLLSGFKSFSIGYVPRDQNKRADFLVNEALDRSKKSSIAKNQY